MKKDIDLSIILIASKSDYILGCIESLIPALEGIKNEIILIDNASVDRVDKKIEKIFPKVRILRRETNGGFGENNNMGIKIASGKYALLLNDDTKITDKNIFKDMILWMDKHPKVGISGCALTNPDGITLQGSGGYYPTLFRVFAWMAFIDDIPAVDKLVKPYHPMHGQSFYKGSGYFTSPHNQDWVTGAFFLMRKSALDEVGMFDEDFFLYVEEVDLATRFIKKGWQVWYLPDWKIIHFGMSTNGSEKAVIFEMQNLILLYKKHEPLWKTPILKAILKFGSVLRVCIWSIVGDKSKAKIYEKAFKSF